MEKTVTKAVKFKMVINVPVTLGKAEVNYLKNTIGFKADTDEKDYDKYDNLLLIGEGKKNQNLADKMVGLGLFQEIVSSWNDQELEYGLTLIGKEIYRELIKE